MIHRVQMRELAAVGAKDMPAQERLPLIAELAEMDCARIGGGQLEAEQLRSSALLALACAHHLSFTSEGQTSNPPPAPPFSAMVDVLAAYFDVSTGTATGWLVDVATEPHMILNTPEAACKA